MEYSEVHRALRDARSAASILQESLAADLGITQGTLSRYETGAQPIPAPLLVRWCTHLGLRVDIAPAQEATPEERSELARLRAFGADAEAASPVVA